MKRGLQILAVVVVIATVSWWAAKGANTKFTKNRIQVTVIDPVTELPEHRWQEVFIPGIEYLGGGLITAGAIFVGSLFIRKSNKQQQTQNS